MPRKSAKNTKPHTVKLSVCLTPEVKQRLIEDSHQKFGNRKGAISINLEQILRNFYSFAQEGVSEV